MRALPQLCLLALVSLSAAGQTYDLALLGETIGDLSKAKWRFHTGDDPQWSRREFDDSKWSLLKVGAPWDTQGYKQYSGIAWYRIRVKVPRTVPLFRVEIDTAVEAMEAYANGAKVGSFGTVALNATPVTQHVFEVVSTEFPSQAGEVVLAVRVWHWPKRAAYRMGGITGGAYVGSAEAVKNRVRLRAQEIAAQEMPGIFDGVLALGAAMFSLVLFRRNNSATEYLWFALSLLFGAVSGELVGWIPVTLLQVNVMAANSFFDTVTALSILTTTVFVARFLRMPLNRFARAYLVFQIPLLLLMLAWDLIPIGQMWLRSLIAGLNDLVYWALILWMTFHKVRISRPARMLAVPMTLFAASFFVLDVAGVLFTSGLSTWTLPQIIESPVRLGPLTLASLLFLCGMAYVMTDRFAESRSEEARLKAEFEAAQQVQTLLLQTPEDTVGRLPVTVCYLPADEVGGDFFKVFRWPDTSAVVIVGDVSGKGLKAAMTVAGLLGALEKIVTERSMPADILSELNQYLVAKKGEGFVTCVCARIRADGEIAIASAGHLPPYLDGKELEVAGSLPLGIAGGIQFEERIYQMQPGSRLALVTDGVVEAMSRSGELFGFERMRNIAAETPQHIAEKARVFGQNDDITVLQVSYAT